MIRTTANAAAYRHAAHSHTAPAKFYFDSTLNQPIWRNTANTGWIYS